MLLASGLAHGFALQEPDGFSYGECASYTDVTRMWW